jgi:hypothetical protein
MQIKTLFLGSTLVAALCAPAFAQAPTAGAATCVARPIVTANEGVRPDMTKQASTESTGATKLSETESNGATKLATTESNGTTKFAATEGTGVTKLASGAPAVPYCN